MAFFWAHWCGDCKQQLPILEQLHENYGERGVAILGPTQLYGYVSRGQDATPEAAGQPYAVCDYLKARGRACVPRMSAGRWISLSDSLDRHRVDPGAITVPTTLLGFTSDQLVPISDLNALAERLPNLRACVRAPSLYGHDGFLKEEAVVADLIASALADPLSCCLSELAA